MDWLQILTFFVALIGVALLVVLLARTRASSPDAELARLLAAHLAELRGQVRDDASRGFERVERELRHEIDETARASRGEAGQQMMRLQQALLSQLTEIARLQNNQIDTFAQQLGRLTESNERRLIEVRATIEQKLRDIETNNATKLEEMRRTVDEKLHATLEQRLGESFKLVSDRLEQVHRGLGEMQMLAQGVGDLKRVLTNVKTRGTWGEVQLEMLLEQMLTAEQYGKNVETVRNSGARVEFAIRLPGRDVHGEPVWLPVDAKFPKEQYERLVDAQERGDVDGVTVAGRELEVALRGEAQKIAEKYLSPPATTDFAILFLPTEGLYAEVLRRPGLTDLLQRNYRVTVAGPTTLTALLNSLQMGFRTLALEKRSSEVWEVLGAVKTEFGKFGEVLAKTRDTLVRAARNIEQAEVRTRQMERKLRNVEALPGELAEQLLGTTQPEAGGPAMESAGGAAELPSTSTTPSAE
ncbi:DNA recombination protein RmuC [Cupriavidus pampae]|uniref:DNA recombination protein RmuC n=1 Tax=Cupriavidus pampae TaxID=659251 RepID=A0ABM8W992_9BURK|nr:DNA recombination protein RmuC [Cupriavidus pampae]CAG9163763.1 hypothetical protein LMG32289_00178 [Cupriavidus pampae]